MTRASKDAGLFEPPPAMVSQIGDWMRTVYAGHVLAIAEQELKRLTQRKDILRNSIRRLDEFKRSIQNLERMKEGEVRSVQIDYGGFGNDFVWGVRREPGFQHPMFRIGRGKRRISFRQSFVENLGETSERLNTSIIHIRNKLWGYIDKLVGRPSKTQDYTLVELKLLCRECLKHTQKAKTYSGKTKRKFPVNIKGWEYLKDYPDAEAKLKKHWSFIECVLDFKGHRRRGGQWNPSQNRLEVDVRINQPKMVKRFHDGLYAIEGTLLHELRHVGQSVLKFLKDLKEEAGLPPHDLRDPSRTPEGYRKDDPYGSRGRGTHTLRDIEFQTDLGNAIREFLKKIQTVRRMSWRNAFKEFTGLADTNNTLLISRYFRTWKRQAPKKWQRAVNELFKEAEKAGIDLGDPMRLKQGAADVIPVRQRNQYNCMVTSLQMCLRANGLAAEETTPELVNKVMGALPMQGASWESAFAAAQHYGQRVIFICPATLRQVKEYTDQGYPVMIAWNPEGRPWSHASVIFDVDDDLTVKVADPNIPDPDETVRVVPKTEFYGKWYEKWPDYLVRRPAMVVQPEISQEGHQMIAADPKRAALNWGSREGSAYSFVSLLRPGLRRRLWGGTQPLQMMPDYGSRATSDGAESKSAKNASDKKIAHRIAYRYLSKE